MSWLGAVYRAAGHVGVGLGVPRWILRDRPQELRERLGELPRATDAVWIHAASVGELAAARPFVSALREGGIGPTALSVMTRTGRSCAEDLDIDLGPFHAPLDAPGPVSLALDRLQPRAWIAMETELWPTLLRALALRGVPRAIVSARLSARGFTRMQRARSLFRPIVSGLSAVAARTEADAERWLRAGVHRDAVRVTGDLKEDHPLPAYRPPTGDRPSWVAACTRPGEEADVLAAMDLIRARVPTGELILAPRHPERFAEVAALVTAHGLPLRSWKDRDEPADPDPAAPGGGWSVLLVDEMGVLDEAYRRGRCAFVGGSLRPFRGHSPWEAATIGRPVVMGPDITNCRDAFGRLSRVGAGVQVSDPTALADTVAQWLQAPDRTEELGRAARSVAESSNGAAERAVTFLRQRGVLS